MTKVLKSEQFDGNNIISANVDQCPTENNSGFNQSMWQREFENHQEFISFSEARFDKSAQ